jgi:hypothetical protein
MAEPRCPPPALLIVAAFSRYPEALDWGRQKLEELFGSVGLISPDFDFHQTRYYEATMGPNLRKRFLVFGQLVPPDCLPEVKSQTNVLELELAKRGTFPEQRPLNLDPGLLTLGKFMLATTKDQAHRVYLGRGIFAEVTLRFEDGSYEPWPWTYRDYREPAIREFLKEARELYRNQLNRLG